MCGKKDNPLSKMRPRNLTYVDVSMGELCSVRVGSAIRARFEKSGCIQFFVLDNLKPFPNAHLAIALIHSCNWRSIVWRCLPFAIKAKSSTESFPLPGEQLSQCY